MKRGENTCIWQQQDWPHWRYDARRLGVDIGALAPADWFLGCLLRAMQGAEVTLSAALVKANFWRRRAGTPMNERQIKLLNRLLASGPPLPGVRPTRRCATSTNCRGSGF